MSFYEVMQKSLSALLEDGETLKYPIYGALVQSRRNYFGYWSLTDTHLLIVLLQGDTKKICYTNRIPLECIQNAKVKKSLIPMQSVLSITFDEGRHARIRVSKKVYGFEAQAENLKSFLSVIKK